MKAGKLMSFGLLVLSLSFWGCSSGSASFSGGGSSGGGNSGGGRPSGASISISPTSAIAGSPDLLVIITGTRFAGPSHCLTCKFSLAKWSANGSATFLTTSFDSTTQITAVIPAALLKNAVQALVRVELWEGGGDVPLSVSKSVSFSVTTPVLSISPSSETLGPKGMRQFVATFIGNNPDVTWNIQEGAAGGTITSAGLYRVPDHLGTFHVIATSAANPSESATATVSVIASGFAETGNMSTPRSGHTATLLANGKVLIVGGGDASAELFDPTTGTFAPTGVMSTTRYGATATLLVNGKVLIVGGYGPVVSELPRLKTAELYDTFTGTFSATGSMALPRVLHAATLLDDGKVLITGGTIDNVGGGVATATSEVYDRSTGVFTTVGNMITDRAQHSATLLAGGEVLIAGGWNGHRMDFADDPPWDPLLAELYNSPLGTFTSSGSMGTTRIGHKAIRLTNGKVLILGGIPNPQNIHAQPIDPPYAQLYDAVAHSFSSPWNLTMSRTGYSATLLTNVAVLLAGGENLGHAVGTTEFLDPASGSLIATGGLVTERKGHTATLLLDGRVLVTGGVDSNGNTLASAEVYK